MNHLLRDITKPRNMVLNSTTVLKDKSILEEELSKSEDTERNAQKVKRVELAENGRDTTPRNAQKVKRVELAENGRDTTEDTTENGDAQKVKEEENAEKTEEDTECSEKDSTNGAEVTRKCAKNSEER